MKVKASPIDRLQIPQTATADFAAFSAKSSSDDTPHIIAHFPFLSSYSKRIADTATETSKRGYGATHGYGRMVRRT